MLPISRFLQLFLLLCGVILLTQCTKLTTESHFQGSRQLASPYTMPADAYLALANNQTGNEKQSLLLMAAGRYIYDGQWQQGLRILTQIGPLSASLLNEKNILLAKVNLTREQPQAAISTLALVREINSMALFYQVQFHEMLALAYQATGHSQESIIERMKLETLLPDETTRANNRRALWLSLTTLPGAELEAIAAEGSDDTTLNGWVMLAKLSRKEFSSPNETLLEIQQWQASYPNHPANHILPSLMDNVKHRLYTLPKQMALLLPLTGPLAGPGNAIKDGFMNAYDSSARRDAVKVRIYNTAGSSVAALYQEAVANGADYIVGPLSKPDVAIVAAMEHPVPTLLLNDLAGGYVKDNAYQFGLSPTSEARQVAAKARKNGFSHALVIAPTGVWGDDVVNAFNSQWRSSGGLIVDTLHYDVHDDLNVAVRNFLHVSESEAREKQVRRVLGQTVESTPRRRQDFDMIFLLAYPTKARQIMPLLKYYFAGDVPVYATSAVYGGSENTMRDRDLNGIIFCDMPWVFAHQMGNRSWPEQFNSYNRLYALGLDSYALSTQLNQLLLFPALGVSDKSGMLYLSADQQISRILVFGQFKQGKAQM